MGEINPSSGASKAHPADLTILSDTGSGKATVVFSAIGGTDSVERRSLQDVIAARLVGRIVVVGLPDCFIQERWRDLPIAVDILVESLGLRHVHLVAVDEATPAAQFLAISRPALVASLLLGNPQFRARSSVIERLVQFLEQLLPLGLPLRTGKDRFFSAAYLQRIRCPVLVVWDRPQTEKGSHASTLVSQLPLGWEVVLDRGDGGASIQDMVNTFREVRVRCPMRRKAVQSSL
jgi:hypothetical protein